MNRSIITGCRLALALLVVVAGACGDNLHPAGSDDTADIDAGNSDGSTDGTATLQAPMVTFTTPSSGFDGSAINVRVGVAFDLPMMALTGATFTLSRDST